MHSKVLVSNPLSGFKRVTGGLKELSETRLCTGNDIAATHCHRASNRLSAAKIARTISTPCSYTESRHCARDILIGQKWQNRVDPHAQNRLKIIVAQHFDQRVITTNHD